MTSGYPDYGPNVQSEDYRNLNVRLRDADKGSNIDYANADDLAAATYGLAVRSLLYGFDGVAWDRLRVDANKYLNVNVQAFLAGGTLPVAEQGTPDQRCFGWDGANWQRLRLESAAQHNLRVRLYSGANAIASHEEGDPINDNKRSLHVIAHQYGISGDVNYPINSYVIAADDLAPANIGMVTIGTMWAYDGAGWDKVRTITPADAVATPGFALGVTSFLMGYDGVDWNMVRVDAQGHLQVDVLSSPNPTNAPNYGQANIRNQLLSLSYTVLNTRLPSALDTDALKVREQGTPAQHIYGFDGTNWQTLLVESNTLKNLRVRLYSGDTPIATDALDSVIVSSGALGILTRSQIVGYNLEPMFQRRSDADALAAVTREMCQFTIAALYGYNGSTWDRLRSESSTAFNLRVKLYDGANGIDSQLVDTNLTTERGLVTCSTIYGIIGADQVKTLWAQITNVDDVNPGLYGLVTVAHLYGYDGAKFDRLRTYGVGILKVGRAEVGLLDVRKTAVGQVGATGARKLFWMLLNPSAGNSVVELTDATIALQPIKADHFDTSRDGHMITFDPPLEFSNGIYLETFTNLTSIVFGYL